MKILMVAPVSLHFFRWTEQLKEAGHDIYWFDVLDGGEQVDRISWVKQIVGWKLKFNYPGRYFMKEKLPKLYCFIQKYNERLIAEVFEQKLLEIQPDVVHSFALYISCVPILDIMKRYKSIKWIYSSWGSDLFYFQNHLSYLKEIKKVLPNIHYLLTDCKRDYDIAKKHGFVGEFLGVFPGGGGFPLEEMKAYLLPFDERNILLIKGFQGRSGRAIPVLKAVERMKESLSEYVIIVFGADKEVVVYADKSVLSRWNNFRIYGKLPQNEVFKWMGKSLIYIGNSNSDGMPNTLLEAICMEVFPIQSNPGGVTEELIVNEENALLINDCEDIDEIVTKLQQAVGNKEMVFKAIASNSKNIKPVLGSKHIKQLVIEKYKNLASNSLR
jgi:hypothetical protein